MHGISVFWTCIHLGCHFGRLPRHYTAMHYMNCPKGKQRAGHAVASSARAFCSSSLAFLAACKVFDSISSSVFDLLF